MSPRRPKVDPEPEPSGASEPKAARRPRVVRDAAKPVAPVRGSMAGLAGAIERQRPAVPLDDVDRELIRRMAKDPRSSQRQLAREVNMSGPAVGERIARLERLGVIKGYTVSVDWAAIGYPVLVYIPMSIAPGADLSQILEELKAIEELEELVAVTGMYDLLGRLRLRDHAHLQTVLLEKVWPIYGLQRIETFLSLGEVTRHSVLDGLLAAGGEIERDER